MSRADLLAKSREHECRALALHVDGRIQRYFGRDNADDLAWQMRDMFRRASLETLADAEVCQ